jgi:hypothetical protein
VLSRTTGLPSYHEAEWEPLGVLSLMLEAAYVLAAARALAAPAATTSRGRPPARRRGEPIVTQY